MKRSLIPAVLIAAVVALSGCASAKDKVSSAVSAVQDAATSAGCTAISSATDALKPYETVSADQVGELKDKVVPVVDKVETAITTLGSKLPGEIGTKVTDASKQLGESVAEADTDPQAAADKASAAVKSLNEQLATASTKLGCD
jgi:hypothetical protein